MRRIEPRGKTVGTAGMPGIRTVSCFHRRYMP